MSLSPKLNLPLNRVEGDLEIEVQITDGAVSDAWVKGTMYRGFEKILAGRDALDGLVITPRICGICSISHLTAAARALDALSQTDLPANALRLRNLVQATEHMQSDLRHAFLMFAADFTNPAYALNPHYEEACRRYAPLKGETAQQIIRETKHLIELIAIVGGQWPHTHFMVPGGVTSCPTGSDLRQCLSLISQFRLWYEERILGCTIERWSAVDSKTALENWLHENDAQRNGDLGFFLRFARQNGFAHLGLGTENFLSLGGLPEPAETQGGYLLKPGFYRSGSLEPLDHQRIAEDIRFARFSDTEGPRHPSRGQTRPFYSPQEQQKYSWCKAPRYDGLPAETGPLAEALMADAPLFTELIREHGAGSVLTRELARITRAARLIPVMESWLEALHDGPFYHHCDAIDQGEGFGFTQASRGALGHWVRIEEGRIAHYQIITPTSWHASPRDSLGQHGPIEQALIGTPVHSLDNPVELGHVVRSFDPCLVCSVHALRKDNTLARWRLGS